MRGIMPRMRLVLHAEQSGDRIFWSLHSPWYQFADSNVMVIGSYPLSLHSRSGGQGSDWTALFFQGFDIAVATRVRHHSFLQLACSTDVLSKPCAATRDNITKRLHHQKARIAALSATQGCATRKKAPLMTSPPLHRRHLRWRCALLVLSRCLPLLLRHPRCTTPAQGQQHRETDLQLQLPPEIWHWQRHDNV